jgi:hypothetical protein
MHTALAIPAMANRQSDLLNVAPQIEVGVEITGSFSGTSSSETHYFYFIAPVTGSYYFLLSEGSAAVDYWQYWRAENALDVWHNGRIRWPVELEAGHGQYFSVAKTPFIDNNLNYGFTIVMEPSASSLASFTRPNTYTPGTFTDIDNAWYTDWIKNSFEYGIIQGIGNNRFDPNGNLTGAQALTIGARIHSVYKYGSAGEAKIQSFARSGDNWYDRFVLCAKAEGLVGNEFDAKMDTPVTRAEMVFAWSKLLEAKDMTTQNTVNSLPDVNANTQYRDAIMLFYRAGIVGGVDSAGTFRPNNNITRAEAATIFMRLVDAELRGEGRTFE